MMHVCDFLDRFRDAGFRRSYARNALLFLWHWIAQDDFSRLYRRVRLRTVLGTARLISLHNAVQQVIDQGIPGDIVECGAGEGGSAALMALTLKRSGDKDRRVWVFDTFEGLPEPSDNDPDFAQNYVGECYGELEDVEGFLEHLGVLSRTKLVKGLFEETIPQAAVGSIALLHVDCDWYDSVKTCLTHLYDRVSVGGVIQVDDYGYWAGARKATDEFLESRMIDADLHRIDYEAIQIVKRAESNGLED